MRTGAGAVIIILIGVCIASEVLFLRLLTKDGRIMEYYRYVSPNHPYITFVVDSAIVTFAPVVVGLAALTWLVARFIRVSREIDPKARRYATPPKDAFALLQRTTREKPRRPLRIQHPNIVGSHSRCCSRLFCDHNPIILGQPNSREEREVVVKDLTELRQEPRVGVADLPGRR